MSGTSEQPRPMAGVIRRIELFLFDCALISAAFTLALLVRYPEEGITPLFSYLPILLVVRVALFAAFGLYNWSFRYAGVWEGVQLFKAILVGSVIFPLYVYAVRIHPTPDQINLSTLAMLAEGAFTLFLVGAGRFSFRAMPYLFFPRAGTGQRALIVGAGDAGEAIAREFLRTGGQFYYPVGFVDDDPAKRGLRIHRWRVLGTCADIEQIVFRERVDVIFLALPPLPGEKIRTIVSICEETKKPIKILPELNKLFQDNGSAPAVRDVRVEDLLSRAEIKPDSNLISGLLHNKRVLITGSAGSIGSELVRQVLSFGPSTLLGVDRNENDLYMLYCELATSDRSFQPIVADILDEERMTEIFKEYRPEIVFHAAAFKHVPLMQEFPEEAVRNNVIGTMRMAKLAEQFGVEKFVYISTDKAVNPTSVMGATKRVGELLLQEMTKSSRTKFCAVRFGNVIGSKGSVVQIFQEQIRRREPLTVTHPDMKRYFMTVREGVCLVLEAGATAQGGEVFMLKMGDEIRIVDLARHLIALHHLVPDRDIPIQFTGIRPGEKMSEELLGNMECYIPTGREHLLLVRLPPAVGGILQTVEKMEGQLGNEKLDFVQWLSRIVPEARLESIGAKLIFFPAKPTAPATARPDPAKISSGTEKP